MKNILQLISILAFILVFSKNTNAQLKISKGFHKKMVEMNMEFLSPLENSYKKVRVYKNQIIKYDYAIKAKKADMEIRFALNPMKHPKSFPHIDATARAASVATNDEEVRMVFHDMGKEDLKEYEADWGMIVFFQPKEMFSNKEHCKMVAIYEEGKGMAYIFYLFDDATEEVDLQKYCLKFEGEEDVK